MLSCDDLQGIARDRGRRWNLFNGLAIGCDEDQRAIGAPFNLEAPLMQSVVMMTALCRARHKVQTSTRLPSLVWPPWAQ